VWVPPSLLMAGLVGLAAARGRGGGATMPPLVIFLAAFALVGGRGGGRDARPLVCFFEVLAAAGRRWGPAMAPLVFFWQNLL
jgi:hypothetical protein